MVLGYWDGHGYPISSPVTRARETDAADQAIASHGTARARVTTRTTRRPRTTAARILPDKSEAPAGDEHDERLRRRLHAHVVERVRVFATAGATPTWSGPAFGAYVELRLTGVTASSADYYYGTTASSLTFERFMQEIDSGRPLVLFVDCSGDGYTDHAVAGIGYRETGEYAEYACWDTWYTAIRWERFRGRPRPTSGVSAEHDALATPGEPAAGGRLFGAGTPP